MLYIKSCIVIMYNYTGTWLYRMKDTLAFPKDFSSFITILAWISRVIGLSNPYVFPQAAPQECIYKYPQVINQYVHPLDRIMSSLL